MPADQHPFVPPTQPPSTGDEQPPDRSVQTGQPASEPGAAPEALDPQRLLRIAGVTREVLEEARRIRPEPGAVDHLRRVYQQISHELREALPSGLWEEFDDLTPDVRDGSLEELALAHAEILGWLEGLFQGTQLAIQLQVAHAAQAAQQAMLDRGRRRLPSPEPDTPDSRYL